ncbi:hypothetical protein E4T56_gene3493 [Termitomyces sp. T112]|nr:hypothetical protein E4T56_gene3493 [Termitomyces sp. T112]
MFCSDDLFQLSKSHRSFWFREHRLPRTISHFSLSSVQLQRPSSSDSGTTPQQEVLAYGLRVGGCLSSTSLNSPTLVPPVAPPVTLVVSGAR